MTPPFSWMPRAAHDLAWGTRRWADGLCVGVDREDDHGATKMGQVSHQRRKSQTKLFKSFMSEIIVWTRHIQKTWLQHRASCRDAEPRYQCHRKINKIGAASRRKRSRTGTYTIYSGGCRAVGILSRRLEARSRKNLTWILA